MTGNVNSWKMISEYNWHISEYIEENSTSIWNNDLCVLLCFTSISYKYVYIYILYIYISMALKIKTVNSIIMDKPW